MLTPLLHTATPCYRNGKDRVVAYTCSLAFHTKSHTHLQQKERTQRKTISSHGFPYLTGEGKLESCNDRDKNAFTFASLVPSVEGLHSPVGQQSERVPWVVSDSSKSEFLPHIKEARKTHLILSKFVYLCVLYHNCLLSRPRVLYHIFMCTTCIYIHIYAYMYIKRSLGGEVGRAPNRLLIHNWSGDGTHMDKSHMDEPCHANARPISHIRINYVIHINESNHQETS